MILFVKECRREWRRLGVPDAVADEMADDLAADLEEAQAEGVALEDVLGGGASDPRSFAASWATARGVTRAPSRSFRAHRKPPIAAALTALLIAALVAGAALVIFGAGELVLRGHHGVALTTRGARVVQEGTQGIALHPLGWTLLTVGMLGIMLILGWSWWSGTGPWTRQLGRRTTSGAAV